MIKLSRLAALLVAGAIVSAPAFAAARARRSRTGSVETPNPMMVPPRVEET